MEENNYWENRISKAVDESKKLNFVSLLKTGWEMYAENAGNMVAFVLLFFLLAFGILIIPVIIFAVVLAGSGQEPNPGLIIVMALMFLALGVFIMALFLGLYIGGNEIGRGRQPSIGEYFNIRPYLPQFILNNIFQILLGLMVLSFTVLPFVASQLPTFRSIDFNDPKELQASIVSISEGLMVPFVISSLVSALLNTLFLFTVALIVRCKFSFFNALGASFRLVTRNYLVYLLIPLIPIIISNVFSRIPLVSILFSLGQLLILLPLSVCMVFAALNELIGKNADEMNVTEESVF